MAVRAVGSGEAGIVAFDRPFIANPYLVVSNRIRIDGKKSYSDYRPRRSARRVERFLSIHPAVCALDGEESVRGTNS